MTIEQARKKVNDRIAQIEAENPVGILQPWDRDACKDASEHWGLVQQRIALSRGNPQGRACCEDLDLNPAQRSEAQKLADARLATQVKMVDSLPLSR